MSVRFLRPGLGFVLAAACSAPLLAAAPTPLDMVKSRVALFNEMGTAKKNIDDELKKDSPTPYFIQIQAREIHNYSQQTYRWFPAGTGQGKGLKTKAKAEVWTQAPQFKAAQDALSAQAKLLMEAAASGDLGKIEAASKSLSGACAACHRQFRADKAG